MPNTLELVAEYAVDLKFALTVVTGFGATNVDPVLTEFPFSDARNYTYAGVVTPASPPDTAPHRIRSVRARLAVRSREGDRLEPLPPTPQGNIFRYAIPGDAGFARARTLTADIALPNLAGVAW
jgi:hypothetical protein